MFESALIFEPIIIKLDKAQENLPIFQYKNKSYFFLKRQALFLTKSSIYSNFFVKINPMMIEFEDFCYFL